MRSDPPGAEPYDGATPSGRFSSPRRLHPASVLLGVNPRRVVQQYVVPIVATFAVAGFTLTVLAVIGLAVLGVRILVWQRFTYSFDGEVLRVDEGVLSRNRRALDVDRIQQVEIDRGFVQRLLGLATVRVETAGTRGEPVELRVIPEDVAVGLRAALRDSDAPAGRAGGLAAETRPSDAGEPTREEVLRVPLAHVVLGAVTGARLLVFPAVVAGAFQFAGPRTEEWFEALAERAVRLGLGAGGGPVPEVTFGTVLVIGGAALVLSVATAIAVGVLRDTGFRIVREGDDLHVSRGLLSTRSSVLPLRRVQLVQVRRNWVRRLLGFAAVRIDSAGGSAAGDRRVTVPLLADGRVEDLLRDVYEGTRGTPDLSSHPRNAMRRSIFRWLRTASYAVAAVWIVPWDRLEPLQVPVLALLPVAAFLGVVEYRQLAHGAGERVVAARQGALSVTTSLAPLVKIQAVTTRANPFQRRLGLATVTAHIAGPGGGVEVVDTGAAEAARFHALLAEHAAAPAADHRLLAELGLAAEHGTGDADSP